jgi:hypothetical protein
VPPKFRELSSFDQFRVCRFLTRGEAADDPELAAITLEVAGRYQTESRVLAALLGWWPMVLALFLIVFALPGALDGQVEMVILFLFIVLGVVGNITMNPWTRPKNVARSMEASRRIVAQMANREDRPSAASDNVRPVDHRP